MRDLIPLRGLVILIACFPFVCGAQEVPDPQAQPTPANQPAPTDSSRSTETRSEEFSIEDRRMAQLEGQYQRVLAENQLLKEFQHDVLATVYWSLGLVVIIFVALAGVNWFTNFRLYERDRIAIRNELETFVTQAIGAQEQVIDSIRSDIFFEIDEKVDRRLTEFGRQYASLNNLSEQRSELAEQIASLDKKLFSVTYNLRLVEAYVWETRGIPDNQVITLAQAISAASAANDKSGVTHALERLSMTLTDAYIKTGASTDQYTFDFAKAAIEGASEYDPVLAGTVSSTLSKIQVEEDPADEDDS